MKTFSLDFEQSGGKLTRHAKLKLDKKLRERLRQSDFARDQRKESRMTRPLNSIVDGDN